MRAAEQRPRGILLPQGGLVQRGCTPHFLFRLAEKKTGRARSKRKGRLGALRCGGPPCARGSAYRCLLRFCLTFGHAIIFCKLDTTVPWRMVRRSSGCKNVFDQRLFPCVPLRYALPGGRRGCCVGPCCSSHQPPASGSEKRSRMYPKLPRAGGFPKGSAFPSLTAARDSQPSPAGGRRSALAQTDPPKRSFLLDRARPVFFSARPKRKWGVHCPAINIADFPTQTGGLPFTAR